MKILVHYDKNNTNYWDASTKEKELAAFLAMFQLLDDGDCSYYQDIEGTIEEYTELVNDLKATEKELKEGKLNKIMERAVEGELQRLPQYERELKSAQEQLILYKAAQKGDAKAARSLIEKRLDYEYEKWSLEEVQDPSKVLA